MPTSSGGHVVSSSDCAASQRAPRRGSLGFAGRPQRSSRIGHYVMATAEHREPCESRGSRTVLGAPGGAIPSGDSSTPPSLIQHRPGQFLVIIPLRHIQSLRVLFNHGRSFGRSPTTVKLRHLPPPTANIYHLSQSSIGESLQKWVRSQSGLEVPTDAIACAAHQRPFVGREPQLQQKGNVSQQCTLVGKIRMTEPAEVDS
jgi:hypothetical protein